MSLDNSVASDAQQGNGGIGMVESGAGNECFLPYWFVTHLCYSAYLLG